MLKLFFAQAEHLERQGREMLEEDIASTDELSVTRRFLCGLPKACQSKLSNQTWD